MTTITEKKNNTINKSTISSSNKSSKKDNEIKKNNEKKTTKKESIDIQDFGSSDDEPILKKKKSTSKKIQPTHTETKQETIHRNLDITILADEKINDRYSKITYLGEVCIMDMTTGYINATKFCSSASDESKRFDNYIRTDRYKNLFEYMESSPEYSCHQYISIQITAGINDLRGTYLHPDLLLDLASWISPIVLIKVTKILNEWRKISPDNEIRFHKDIGDAIKEGVGMFKNNNSESVIRDKIAVEENGIVEFPTEVGFIDVSTDTKIIEVKKYHNWKHALGQVQCYGYFYPNKQKWVYLFDTDDTISTKLINEICNSKDVFVKYI